MFAWDDEGLTTYELVDSLARTLSKKRELFEGEDSIFSGELGAYNLAEQLGTGLGQSGKTKDIIAAAKYSYDVLYRTFFPEGNLTRHEWKVAVLEQVMLREQ